MTDRLADIAVLLRPLDDLPLPDPRSVDTIHRAMLARLAPKHRIMWEAMFPLVRVKTWCVNCYVARVPCIGHTMDAAECPRRGCENIMTAQVMFEGRWQTFKQVRCRDPISRTSADMVQVKSHPSFMRRNDMQRFCFSCWWLWHGMHRGDFVRGVACQLEGIIPPLLFMFWIHHKFQITSTQMFAEDMCPRNFEEYWTALRMIDPDLYPVFVRYVIEVVKFLGTTQLPLPAV